MIAQCDRDELLCVALLTSPRSRATRGSSGWWRWS